MNHPHTVTYTTVAGDEPLVAVYAQTLTLTAELLERLAHWLRIASPAVHADLATHGVPGLAGPARFIADLDDHATHLHHLAQGATR